MNATRIGVIGGSVCSAVLGTFVLKRSSPEST
jgi:hypothetical protein